MIGEGSYMAPGVVVVGQQYTAPGVVVVGQQYRAPGVVVVGQQYTAPGVVGQQYYRAPGVVGQQYTAPGVVGQQYTAPGVVGQQYTAPGVVVVGQQFMAPYSVDLTIVRKMMTISGGNFGVTDANGNIMFKVKGKALSLRSRRVLLDANGNPIVSFQEKIMSMRSTWKVYRGDSNDSRDLLFTVRRSSLFQFKTQLDVFLASNTSKDNRDFKIKGSWFEKSCTIYAGNSSTVIAQMHRKTSFSSIVLGKDKFAVTVYPHVDYAFIVALIVILEEINEEGG